MTCNVKSIDKETFSLLLIGKMETRVQMSGAEPTNPSFVVIDFSFLLNEPKIWAQLIY